MGLHSSRIVEVWCDGCETEPEAIHTVGVTQKEVAGTLRAIGWSVSGPVVKCPDCRTRRIADGDAR